MKTTIAPIASNLVSSDIVTLSLDVDTLQVLNAAAETATECASAMMLRCDDADIA